MITMTRPAGTPAVRPDDADAEEKRRETWAKFKAARDRWWEKPTQPNYRAYKSAERAFLSAWGTDDIL